MAATAMGDNIRRRGRQRPGGCPGGLWGPLVASAHFFIVSGWVGGRAVDREPAGRHCVREAMSSAHTQFPSRPDVGPVSRPDFERVESERRSL